MNSRFILFALGVLIFYAHERFDLGFAHSFLISMALWVFVATQDVRDLRQGPLERKTFTRFLVLYRLAFFFGIQLYLMSVYFETSATFLPKLLSILSFVFIAASLVWGMSLESLAWRNYSLSSSDEVRAKAYAWLKLVFILITLSSINFIANKWDKSFDASYLKMSQAGEATRVTVQRLSEPVRVGLFFSRKSETRAFLEEYFSKLDRNKLKIEFYDKDFNPTQAEEFRVAKNGQVVVMTNGKRQRFEVGDTMDVARRNLRTLDASFLKAILQLTSKPTTVYFTSTHGEMLWETGTPVRTMALFEELLRGLNYRSRRLTSLFQDMPSEAKVIGIVGPTTSFTADEIRNIDDYLNKGGRVFLSLDIDQLSDPKSQDALVEYLKTLGVSFHSSPLLHDKKFVSGARDKTDRVFLYSNVFEEHPSVATAALSPDRLTFMTHRSGSFDLKAVEGWKITPVVRSLKGSFRDVNGNLDWDANEPRGSYPIVVALENTSKGKLVVYSDTTALSDVLMKVSANQLVAIDSMRWLTDRTEEAGSVASEEDVLIRHERSRETLLFYGSIFVLPLFVLLLGFVMTRRPKRKVSEESQG